MRRRHEPYWEIEPQLALQKTTSESQVWLRAAPHAATTLDVRRWQRRAARGLSWNRNGFGAERRDIH